MLLVPSTTVTVRAIPVENTVRERVLIFLITVILRPRLTHSVLPSLLPG